MLDDAHPLVRAIRPVLEALGAVIVSVDEARIDDIALEWEGRVVAAVRLPKLHGALDRMIAQVEDISGRKAAEEALALAEERNRLALEATDMAAWEYDVAADRITRSPGMPALYGLEAAPGDALTRRQPTVTPPPTASTRASARFAAFTRAAHAAASCSIGGQVP